MFARHDLLRLATRNGACRYLSTGSKPHAYLRPLTASKGDTSEFEGTMCLTMDRPDARNALSVQMVNVSAYDSLTERSQLMNRSSEKASQRRPPVPRKSI